MTDIMTEMFLADTEEGKGPIIFYEVQFKCYVDLYTSQEKREIGDMVIVHSDRGYHVGFISREVGLEEIPIGTLDGTIKPKKIISHLIDEDQTIRNMLKSKIAAENYALAQCKIHSKGRRLGVFADTISAEFQFDRKKLTIFIKKYDDVSVCRLVRKLYDTFKMRIKVLEVDSANVLHDLAWKYLHLSKLDIPFGDVFNFNMSSSNSVPFLLPQQPNNTNQPKNHRQKSCQQDQMHQYSRQQQSYSPPQATVFSHYRGGSEQMQQTHQMNSFNPKPQYSSYSNQPQHRHSAPSGLVRFQQTHQTARDIPRSKSLSSASFPSVPQPPIIWSSSNYNAPTYDQGFQHHDRALTRMSHRDYSYENGDYQSSLDEFGMDPSQYEHTPYEYTEDSKDCEQYEDIPSLVANLKLSPKNSTPFSPQLRSVYDQLPYGLEY